MLEMKSFEITNELGASLQKSESVIRHMEEQITTNVNDL